MEHTRIKIRINLTNLNNENKEKFNLWHNPGRPERALASKIQFFLLLLQNYCVLKPIIGVKEP